MSNSNLNMPPKRVIGVMVKTVGLVKGAQIKKMNFYLLWTQILEDLRQ
jgi:hypothetical protein